MSGRNKSGGFWRYHSHRRRRAKSNSHDDCQMPKAKEKQEGLLLKERFYLACLASLFLLFSFLRNCKARPRIMRKNADISPISASSITIE